MGFFRAKKSAAVEPVADGPSATEAKPAKGKAAKKKGSKGKAPAQIKALAGVPAGETWAEALDDTTGYPYYTSSVNGEIVWELPAGAVVAGSGQDGHGGGGGGAGVEAYDPETGAGFFSEAGEVHKRVQLAAFEENMPSPVSSLVGDTGKAVVFPGIFPVSPLVRVSVVENLDPPRHRVLISLGDPEDEASEDWLPSLYFFAFACPMPLTLPYTVEFRRDPGCHRLRQAKNPQSRDITVWSQDDVVRGFFAYPEPVAGTSTFCLDWSSGPDRYKVSDNPAAPDLGWLRCVRFQAYAAQKYHVLESRDPILAYRVHRGHFCPNDAGWTCLFAFFAFDSPRIPGTSQYYLQHRYEPHFTTRVAKEPSTLSGWRDDGTFVALDVPLPGTCKYSVDFMTRDVETRAAQMEMSRIWAEDTWEPWVEKIAFYAYPAPTILFAPPRNGALY